MKKLIFVSLFVLILQLAVFAQSREFDSGLELAQAGDFQTALQQFQKSFGQGLSTKKLAQIHYNIGVCLYRLKQTNEAVTEFEKAVQLNPNYEKAFYALGMALNDLNDFGKAETAFRKTIKIANGRNGEAWFDLAFIYIAQKKYNDAFVSFQKAIDFGSRATAASHNNLGVIHALKGNFKASEKEFEKADKLGFSEATNNLNILRKAVNSNDKTLLAKLTLKENTDEDNSK